MIWGLIDFLKKIAFNIAIHIGWFFLYLLIVLLEHSNSDIFYNFCYFTYDNGLLCATIFAFVFNCIICKIYKKNPCQSIVEKYIYWSLSILQSANLFVFWLNV